MSSSGAAQASEGEAWGLTQGEERAPLGATLALTASFAVGSLLCAIGLVFALAHPEPYIARFIALGIAEQNQTAKTLFYVLGVLVAFPIPVLIVPRIADRIARGPSPEVLEPLAALVAGGLGLAVLATRLSAALPWGDGLWVLTAAVGAWLAAAIVLTACAAAGRALRALRRASAWSRPLTGLAAVAVIGALVAPTKGRSWHVLPLALGALVVAGALIARARPIAPGWRVARTRWLDGAIALVLLVAVVPAVVVGAGVGLPNLFVPPGIVQYHQDFLLGPANQLLREGGALMVNVPISQYGVGPIYLLDAVFHVLPIGYGTYGLLDGVLTALFYLAGYAVLRIAGVRRTLAASAIAIAVVALIYALQYPVGELPQQGPLRFGLPMVVVVGLTLAARWPRRAGLGRALAFAAVGVSAIWALETFAYTALTLVVMLGVVVLLWPVPDRRRWLARQALIAVGACAAAHAILAGWTLAATGHLPDWGEYATYIHEFLLGQTSQDTYGFERWSPVLAVACGTLVAAVALAVVLWRARAFSVRERTTMLALAGLTTVAVVLLSYSDNRSSTYLIAYVALPLLLVATLWLHLLLHRGAAPAALRTAAVVAAGALATVLVASAWPALGRDFSRSVLAHAYPGGGLGAAAHQILHPPAVDPRAPAGEALVNRYLPGRRVLVLTPLYPDLTTEILMRDGRANFFFTGDPKADSYVPSVWTGTVQRQIDALPAGTRVLVDASALRFLAAIRTQPGRDVVAHPVGLGDPEVEWVLEHLQRRFAFRPLATGPDGFVIEQLIARAP